MKTILLLPFCALLGSTGALAQQDRDAPNWVRIKTENDGNTSTFVDLKSIRAGNGYRQAWAKEVFRANRNAIDEVRVQYEFDCKAPALRVIRIRVQLQDGTIEDQTKDEGWVYILPEDTSGLKALHVAVCGARVRA